MDQKPKIGQDVSWERHILCNDCETYFCRLEDHFAATVKVHIDKAIPSPEFDPIDIQIYDKDSSSIKAIRTFLCWKAKPLMVQLFVESILFRVHISQRNFKNFRLLGDLADTLRFNLMKFRSTDGKAIFDECSSYSNEDVLITRYFLWCPQSEVISEGPIVLEKLEITQDSIKLLAGEFIILVATDDPRVPLVNGRDTTVRVLRLTNDQYLKMYLEMFYFHFEIADQVLKSTSKEWHKFWSIN